MIKLRNVWESAKLPLLFTALAVLSILFQIFGNAYIAGLGENLFSEFAGAAVAVFGIDYLLKSREAKRLLPVKASSYEDVRLVTCWALNLWAEAYKESVDNFPPNSWAELFSEKKIDEILVSLDIRKNAPVIPEQNWGKYFAAEMKKINAHAERVLERHGAALDPEVHNAIYALVYYDNSWLPKIIAVDQHLGTPRPTNLGSYVPAIREWFESILELYDWTEKVYPYLLKNGMNRIHAPNQFRPITMSAGQPAGFEIGELDRQAEKFKAWQDRVANNAE